MPAAMRPARFLIALVVTMGAVAAAAGQEETLPTPVRRQTDELVRAFGQADAADSYEAARTLLEQSGPDQTVAVERRLAAAGVNVSLADAVADGRRRLLDEDALRRVAPPGPVESPLILGRWLAEAEVLERSIEEALGPGFQLNMPHEVIDTQLQELPGYVSLADDLRRVHEDAGVVLKNELKRQHDLSGVPALAGRGDFTAETGQAEKWRDTAVERIVQLAWVQIPDMLDVLADQRTTYERKLAAVRRLNNDAALLERVADAYRRREHRTPDLPTAKELDRRLAEAGRRYRQVSPRFREQVHHLERAIYWWKRGRYGLGESLGGIAKTVSPRARNQELAQQIAPLWMPLKPVVPEGPAAQSLEEFVVAYPPPYRHLWAWRQLASLPAPVPDVGSVRFARSPPRWPATPTGSARGWPGLP